MKRIILQGDVQPRLGKEQLTQAFIAAFLYYHYICTIYICFSVFFFCCFILQTLCPSPPGLFNLCPPSLTCHIILTLIWEIWSFFSCCQSVFCSFCFCFFLLFFLTITAWDYKMSRNFKRLGENQSKTTKNWFSLNIKNLQAVWTAYIIHAVYIMVTWISESIIVSWRSAIMWCSGKRSHREPQCLHTFCLLDCPVCW